MRLDLTDYELETVARACRALAHRERESAETISDPSLRGPAVLIPLPARTGSGTSQSVSAVFYLLWA